MQEGRGIRREGGRAERNKCLSLLCIHFCLLKVSCNILRVSIANFLGRGDCVFRSRGMNLTTSFLTRRYIGPTHLHPSIHPLSLLHPSNQSPQPPITISLLSPTPPQPIRLYPQPTAHPLTSSLPPHPKHDPLTTYSWT